MTFATRPKTDPKLQLADALTHVRDSRHHSGCRCGIYRRPDYAGYRNSPFCSKEEFCWSVTVDRLLEAVRRNRF